jgi:hypothetical protein
MKTIFAKDKHLQFDRIRQVWRGHVIGAKQKWGLRRDAVSGRREKGGKEGTKDR